MEMRNLNIIDKDIFILDKIEDLIGIYRNNEIKNKPFAIIVDLQGELVLETNIKRHKLKQKQILIYLPYNKTITGHTTSNNFEVKILCLSEKIMMDNFSMGNELWEKSFTLREEPIIDINEEVYKLFECYGNLLNQRYSMRGRSFHKEVITSLMKAFLYELLNEVGQSVETPGKHLLKQGDILFKKFITLLSETNIKPRMVSWYAQQLCVTPKYLSTTCKNVSGKSATVWINQYVMKDISHMLIHSEKSIKEISDYMNFPNLSFFGKYVKSHFGISPKEYRLRMRTSGSDAI
jgi:AraC-like DNA-binding protein